ncbi:hypothetical protein Acsp03_40130 [Actinomadura sp. NBRC 104412]|uniref:VOC family protein n=1 Tax=Actinomadura sp. NBRC 104412 TaxID=3032203 RepID=UPI0024A53131|nr:VOC family protein [Actinomadura sp. NBRC 104412]GLZ06547.1 hypothetical protein Acsp03_40130 [Actinomadura sp. NBRC 104412]
MPLGAVIEAVVATCDPAASIDFHTRAFGLDVLERDAGGALLGVAGSPTGRLRLAAAPGAPATPAPGSGTSGRGCSASTPATWSGPPPRSTPRAARPATA